MFILERDDQELFEKVHEQNLNRQYSLLTDCIEIGLIKGPAPLDKFLIWTLNHVAEAGSSQMGRGLKPNPFMLGVMFRPTSGRRMSGWAITVQPPG